MLWLSSVKILFLHLLARRRPPQLCIRLSPNPASHPYSLNSVYSVTRFPSLTPWYHNGDATGTGANPLTPKLTTMEVFGDSNVHWVKVTANPLNEEVFNVVPRRASGN